LFFLLSFAAAVLTIVSGGIAGPTRLFAAARHDTGGRLAVSAVRTTAGGFGFNLMSAQTPDQL
jgi:hypothetical protein